MLAKYQKGDLIEGTVSRHEAFGVFLDLKMNPVIGLIRIVNFSDKIIMTPKLYPKIGTKVKGIITDFNEENMQINISIKSNHLEK